MPATYDSLRALSRQTMKKLLDVQEWRKFLAFASRSFKLPFPAQVLAYAQRPDAAALMKSSDWEAVYGRPVKKGCHGVPVPEGRGKKLVYYYDIADTRETDESRPVPLWHVRPENQKGIGKALESYLGKLEDASGFAETLLAAARKTVACTLDDRLDDLAAHSPGSLLEELDSDNLLAAYRAMIENSVGYMLLSRCGLDPSPHFIDEDFYGLLDFNTPSTLTILGSAVTETAAMCLSVIAKAMRRMQAVPQPFQSPRYSSLSQRSATPCKADGSLPLWAATQSPSCTALSTCLNRSLSRYPARTSTNGWRLASFSPPPPPSRHDVLRQRCDYGCPGNRPTGLSTALRAGQPAPGLAGGVLHQRARFPAYQLWSGFMERRQVCRLFLRPEIMSAS